MRPSTAEEHPPLMSEYPLAFAQPSLTPDEIVAAVAALKQVVRGDERSLKAEQTDPRITQSMIDNQGSVANFQKRLAARRAALIALIDGATSAGIDVE